MKNKVLKSHTIVPPNLYVQREADRLLSHVIEDMGRPGYILVARQMGKTNLLINAKRALPSADDVYVYVDLSNSFRDARECFRYIIDLLIETNEEKLYFVQDSINKARLSSDKADHLEHVSEIRKILQVIKGKIVIILDEVDALTKVNFSDTIFKQIRSIYFSRTNYPDLWRLTYVLSGVAEPSSLIKDPKISPFNIGQSISLGDFSINEFREFIQKSKLIISDTCLERIYYWTNGNPRITYDLCSSVEDFMNENLSLSIFDIDKLVENLYLLNYDRAPIDHIRDLVKKSPDMAKAILEILKGKSESLDRDIKRKLYLSGIVGTDFESNDTVIKNKIIEASLPIKWLTDIVREESSLLENVSKAFAEKNYDNVIMLLESVLDNDSVLDQDYFAYEHLILSSYFQLARYNNVVDYFNKKKDSLLLIDEDTLTASKLESIYLCALSLYYLAEFIAAADAFKAIVDLKRYDILYFRSLLNLGSAVHRAGDTKFELSNKDIYNTALAELSNLHPQIKSSEVLQLRNILHYNLGQYYYDENNASLAEENFLKALKLGVSASRPPILYALSLLSSNTEEKSKYLTESIDYIVDSQLKPQDFSPDNQISLSYLLLYKIFTDTVVVRMDYAKKLAFYLLSVDLKIAGEESNKNLFGASIANIESISKDKLYTEIYSALISELPDAYVKHGYKVFKESSYLKIDKVGSIFIEPMIDRKLVSHFDDNDLMHYCVLLNSTIENNTALSEKIFNVLNTGYFSVSNNPSKDAVSAYYEMRIMTKLSKHSIVLDNAKRIIKIFSNENPQPFSFLNEDAMTAIKESAAKTYTGLWPLFENHKILDIKDRNKKVTAVYKNGKVLLEKFKKIEQDVKTFKCIIISD